MVIFLIILVVWGLALAVHKARQDAAVRATARNARQQMKARKAAIKAQRRASK